MNAQLDRVPREICRRSFLPARLDSRSKAQRQDGHEDTIQLIYAYLPPTVVLAAEQHLRAQTQIEQRAQQLWFARSGCPGGALNDWLRAEREVAKNLCDALLHRNIQELESAPVLH